MQHSEADPFGTAELRRAVLDGWTASPARFREDANAEEDYALGGYRDRVIVELAAECGRRGGARGRGRPAVGLMLREGTLVAANTGAPLDAAGVAALSSLRASSKRGPARAQVRDGEATVGRFGVGFAAAVAVSDEPQIASLTGAVGWSRSAADDLVRRVPGCSRRARRRSGQLPVLRLPFAAAGAPPRASRRQSRCCCGTRRPSGSSGGCSPRPDPRSCSRCLLSPRIEIEVDGATRVLTAAHDGDGVTITVDGFAGRWRTAGTGGQTDQRLLADRPAEERAGPSWSDPSSSGPSWWVRWAVPVAADSENGELAAGRLPGGVSAVVHAPTPTDEPLGLPALLLASFPLSPDRRHVAPGPLTDFLLDQAAEVYAALLPSLAPGASLLDLVPSPVAHGELDAQLRGRILRLLPDTAFLPAAEQTGRRVRPGDAVVLDASVPGLTDSIAPVLPDLVAGPASRLRGAGGPAAAAGRARRHAGVARSRPRVVAAPV